MASRRRAEASPSLCVELGHAEIMPVTSRYGGRAFGRAMTKLKAARSKFTRPSSPRALIQEHGQIDTFVFGSQVLGACCSDRRSGEARAVRRLRSGEPVSGAGADSGWTRRSREATQGA